MTRTISILSILVVACSDEPEGVCDANSIGTASGCLEGSVCAEVSGAAPACFPVVEIRGQVLDSTTLGPIAGASIVALDPNGGAASNATTSGPDGTYALPLPVVRDGSGAPLSTQVTLRVSASGYQTFPTAPRQALPIDLAMATGGGENPYVVMNATTDVLLIPLPMSAGLHTLSGVVDTPNPGGILVVAEQGGAAVSTAVSDAEGDFVLFNVPAGETILDGYRSGVDVTAQTVAVAASMGGIVLGASTEGLSTVTGTVQIVNGGECDATSVILVVESTFVENVARGEAPAGLRVADVSGAFMIENVPPGRYVVLAAFENDSCVRDPDVCISGTDVVHIGVPEEAAISESFKVTGALAVRTPGANMLEAVTDANPTFSWEDDSSEDGYELAVYDAFGTLVHENTMVPEGSGTDVTYQMTGVTMQPGMIYQFRAKSFRRMDRCFISSTEDLRGVFVFQP
jgi:hypothetical protein